MSVPQLLDELAGRGVDLWVEGDALRFRAPRGALGEEERRRLAEHRAEILGYLKARVFEPAAVPREAELNPDPGSRFAPFPLTDIQQAYWLGQDGAFDLGSASAHLYVEYEFPGLDRRRLERAFGSAIARHDMLRAEVLPDGRQRVRPDLSGFFVPEIDLSALPEGAAEAALLALRRHLADHGPRLDRCPLFETCFVRRGRSAVRLAVSVSLIICDALSALVLIRELLALYADPAAPLSPLEITFRDCVLALDAERETDAYRASLAHWRRRAAALPPAPELPLARSPAGMARPRFERFSGRLPPGVWRRLKANARASGVTSSAALCSAYAEVLARWSKEPRFTLNLLFFNRPPLHSQVLEVVGNFSATILLEVDAAGAGPFAPRAKALQEQLWRDVEHSRVSGVEVIRELHRLRPGERRSALPVVFASTLDLKRAPGADVGDDAWGRALAWSALQTPQVWLDHQVSEQGGALEFNWDAVEGLFPPRLVRSMFDAYRRLLAHLAGEPARWGEPLPELLAPAELAARLAANATAAPLPAGLLHEPFLRQAARRPEAVAVVAAEQVLTYGELARRARGLARRLRELGAAPDRLVAVVMVKGWEQVVACLAVLEAGAAYLPIDAELPRERLLHLLARSEAAIALTQTRFSSLDWPPGVAALVVDREEPEPAGLPPFPPVQQPGDLAYVIFTSGSTGEPKGVMIDHRSALNTVADVDRRFGIGPGDGVLALSELNFDLSVWDLFGILGAGGKVVLPDPGRRREPRHWRELVARHGVTVWNSVPALAEMLADHLAGLGETHGSLRLFLLSGDWIPVTLPGRLRAAAPGAEVVSLGGATEASIWSILHPVGDVDPAWPSIPYGRPMANQNFHVLDEALRPRPVWVPGQLYIGGAGVARGYWRDEERTRASFVVHPETGERLYATGDLGRYLPDGTVEFLGREDFQVKIQGFRIELGEIEAHLLRHPGVAAAAAAAVGEARGAKRLVAWVVFRAGAAVPAEELRAFLLDRLPEYMVPGQILALPALPLTANGKVDRSRLPSPAELGSGPARERVEPRDELERELAGIWQELLGAGPGGVTADFFELGGHSLLAVRLMGCLRERFGVELPLATLFAAPTVERLALALRDRRPEEDRARVVIQAGGPRPPLFLVHPVGGNVLCYRELARRLGPEQPVHGLQTPARAFASLEEMAAGYLREVREAQPRGPYHLGGWSMGGVVAFEVARQLAAAGEAVALLALIDALPARDEELDDTGLMARFARDLAGSAGPAEALPRPDELQPLSEDLRLSRILAWARGVGLLPADAGPRPLARLWQAFRRNSRLLAAYRPGAYGGGLLLLAAEAGAGPAAGAAWTAFARGPVEAELLPGDHYTLLQPPGLDRLAGALARRLALSSAN